jgi:hypothetical protein
MTNNEIFVSMLESKDRKNQELLEFVRLVKNNISYSTVSGFNIHTSVLGEIEKRADVLLENK